MAKKLPPNLELRGDVYRYRVKVNGKLHRINLHTRNFNEAMVKYRDILANGHETFADNDVTPGASRPRYKCVREFARDDINRQRETGSSEHTIKCGLEQQWKRILKSFDSVDQVTEASVSKYYRDHRAAGLAHQSIKRDIPLLRRLSEWAHGHHADVHVVTWKVPKQSTRVRHEKGVAAGQSRPVDDLRKWLSLLRPAARAQAELVLHTGLRAFEVRRISELMVTKMIGVAGVTAMLDLPSHVTKGGIPRRIGLTSYAEHLLRHFAAEGKLARDYRRQFITAGQAVFKDTVTLRDLRHTFASLASRHDPDATRLAMGHTTGDKNSGMFYQHATDLRLARIALAVQQELGLLAG